MEGWIKLYRQIKEHWIWGNPKYFQAWITILIEVNHEEKNVLIGNDLIQCSRGQSLLSLQNWAALFGNDWTIQKVRHFFDLLKNDSMIDTEGMKYTTRLTVCNYEKYQSEQQTENKLKTFKQHSDNILTTTNKNDKECKECKEDIYTGNTQEITEKYRSKKFIIPTVEEIAAYCKERNNSVSPEKFFNHYEANGWMVGKTKMKDWKAAVRKWELNEKESGFKHSAVSHHQTNNNYADRFQDNT